MKVALLKANPRGKDSVIVLERLPAVIGRDPACELQIEDIWLSPCHCMIEQVCGVIMVLDLAARTGTFVNGQRVRKAALVSGDRLTIGRTDLVVTFLSPSLSPTATADEAAG